MAGVFASPWMLAFARQPSLARVATPDHVQITYLSASPAGCGVSLRRKMLASLRAIRRYGFPRRPRILIE